MAILDGIYDGVILTDPNGVVNDFNKRVCDYFDYPAERIKTMNIMDLISGLDKKYLKTVEDTLRNEHRLFIEGFCKRKDGSVFPADIAVSVIVQGDKPTLAYFIRNISTRVKTEEMLAMAVRIIELENGITVAEPRRKNIDKFVTDRLEALEKKQDQSE